MDGYFRFSRLQEFKQHIFKKWFIPISGDQLLTRVGCLGAGAKGLKRGFAQILDHVSGF